MDYCNKKEWMFGECIIKIWLCSKYDTLHIHTYSTICPLYIFFLISIYSSKNVLNYLALKIKDSVVKTCLDS